MNEIIVRELHNRLSVAYPEFTGLAVHGDVFQVYGITQEQGQSIINDVLANAAAIIAAHEAALALVGEQRQAAVMAVDASRPLEYANFLTAPKEHILLWIDQHGPGEAFWAIICVLRYLVACKDRQKYQ